jgi:hypothetical protein
MANVKISDLTAAAAATSTQQFEVNDSGASKSVTGAQLKSFILGDVTASAAELNILDGATVTTAELNLLDGKTAQDFFPSGGIIIWSGAANAIPSGWLLCDGANGTPNLRDRFVVGAGTTYAVGATGGQNAITSVPSHTHGAGNFAAASAGAHSHNGTTANSGNHAHFGTGVSGSQNGNTRTWPAGTGRYNINNGFDSTINWLGPGGDHAHNFSTSNTGAHTHTISGNTASTGDASVDTRPPYYALCYIMKG